MNINDCNFNIKIYVYISHCAIINLDKKYSTRTKRPRTYTAQGISWNFGLSIERSKHATLANMSAVDIVISSPSANCWSMLAHWYDFWGVKQGAQTSPGWIPLNPSSKKSTPSFIHHFPSLLLRIGPNTFDLRHQARLTYQSWTATTISSITMFATKGFHGKSTFASLHLQSRSCRSRNISYKLPA